MASTEYLSDAIAQAASFFASLRPLLPMHVHIIGSAILPIYAGAHASLSRPSSAAKSSPKSKRRGVSESDDDDEDIQKMEGLSNSDAIILPVTAAIVLASLYFLITRYGADMINFIMGWYFAAVGMFSVAKLLGDMAEFATNFLFPTYSTDKGFLWQAHGSSWKVLSPETTKDKGRESPLPGVFGRIPLPAWTKSLIWALRRVLKQKYIVKAYVATLLDLQAKLTLINVVAALLGIANAGYVTFVDKPWFLTNLQGFAVSYCALQLLSPTSFATGSLILSALFFYDIWAVFFTPLMITVATELDQPIKLVFPRPDEPGETPDSPPIKNFSMLGLGDIVVPGIMIGLALRFDLYMFYLKKQKKSQSHSRTRSEASGDVKKAPYVSPKNHWGDRFWTSSLLRSHLPSSLSGRFPKPYFTASMIGYILAMAFTFGIMAIFQHPQPALLYLVPGVLISLWGTGLVRRELGEMWRFSEAVTGDQLAEKEQPPKEAKDTAEGESSPGLFQRAWNMMFDSKESGNKDSKKEKASPKKPVKEDAGKSTKAESTSSPHGDLLVNFTVEIYNADKHSRSKESRKTKARQGSGKSDADADDDDAVMVSAADLDEPGPSAAARRRSLRARSTRSTS